jgi:hypothetical protein
VLILFLGMRPRKGSDIGSEPYRVSFTLRGVRGDGRTMRCVVKCMAEVFPHIDDWAISATGRAPRISIAQPPTTCCIGTQG